MGNIKDDIYSALRNQRNIVVVDNRKEKRREGYELAVPALKDFCITELEIERPETPVFDFSKTDDLEKWSDMLSEYYQEFCKERHYLLNSFQDYIVALNDGGVFPILHNFHLIGSWNDRLREFYGYCSQLPSRLGDKYVLPRAVATVSKRSWKKRNDYNRKIRCCFNSLEYNKNKWELAV